MINCLNLLYESLDGCWKCAIFQIIWHDGQEVMFVLSLLIWIFVDGSLYVPMLLFTGNLTFIAIYLKIF